MFARFTFRKINFTASRLSSWISNSNTSSKSSGEGNKRHSFKARGSGKSALSKLQRNKRALLVVLLLASSAAALASLGIWRAAKSAPSVVPAATTASGAPVSPTTADLPLTKLKEYVYAGGRLITSEEKSCASTINSSNASFPQEGGLGSVDLSITSGCNWTATPSANWITITSGSSGTEAGTVDYSIEANSGPQRIGTITINGQPLNITQAPNINNCVYTLDTLGATIPWQGESRSFRLTTDNGCPWLAQSLASSWLTVNQPTSGTGWADINYTVAANNSGEQRTGEIRVGGKTFTVTQPPNPSSCSYSLNDTDEPVSEQGGSGSLTMTAGAGCAWTAVSNASWLTVTSPPGGNGSGTGPIGYLVVANNSGAQRTGMITARGRNFTVTQPPIQASCTFALSPSSWSYPVEGGTGSFNVTTGAGCRWDAVNAYGWITIDGGATGTGDGKVLFTVHANNDGSRSGTISIRGRDFTINQCGYVVSPPSQGFNKNGGAGSVTVSSVAAGCSWSATSNAEWIFGVSPTNGAGNGSVNYYVDIWFDVPNGNRQGTLTIAGKTVTIYQIGPIVPECCFNDPPCQTDCDLMVLDQSARGAGTGGLTARYFGNTTLSGQPALQRTDAVVNFNWAGSRPDAALPSDHFGVRWSGKLAAPSSEAFTFYLISDAGARVWVNNQLVIDRWQPPFERQTRSAPVELKADEKADIRVEYYNAGGKAEMRLLWSSPSTPKQIVPQQYLYPEASTNKSTPTDTTKQTGMLLPPGSDAGPKATQPHLSAPGRWLASPAGRAGLILLIACGVLALLLRINWRKARGRFTTSVAGVTSRLRDQLAARLGELFRIADAVSEKLQFVAGFGKRLLAGTYDKLNVASFGKRLFAGICDELRFVGHFLTAFLPAFRVVSHCGAIMRLGGRKLAGLAPERMRTIVRQALSFLRGLGLGRLKPALRRAMVIFLVVTLATPISPAQADGLVRAAQAAWRAMSAYKSDAAYRYGSGSGAELINRSIETALGKGAGKAFSPASQAELVDELQVCPSQLVMFVGESYTLTPVALDVNPSDGSKTVVHRVGMSWDSSNASVAEVSSFGQVIAKGVGNTTVHVQSGSVIKDIPVEVRTGTRPTGSNQEADIDPTGGCSEEQASMFAPRSPGASAQQNLLDDIGVQPDWDPLPALNSRAAHFKNAVGNPRFSAQSRSGTAVPTSTQLGSYSYQFHVPVTRVGGRGASASIGMTFNSRVWNADDGKLTFNYVGAYPAPGWSIGFGKIIRNYNATATGDKSGVGSGNSPGDYLMVSGDGTRVRLAAKYDPATGLWFNEPDDGSFWRFDPRGGEMRYPDGSRTVYSSVNGCLLPTAMINTNGGAITMTYRDYCEGSCQRVFRHRTALSAVRDTLGNYVTFHYYGDGGDYIANAAAGRPEGELAAIKAPDMDGVQQEVIRVEYEQITLVYDFGGIAVNAPASGSPIQVVRRIHYPQTGRGFLFQDYSSYGMPCKISSRDRMKGAGGAITDGVEIAYTTYDYNQEGTLNDFPQFRFREERWLGKTNSTGAPTSDPTVYEYSRTTSASTEEATIIYHGKNCKEVTTTGTDSGQPSFGKVISVELKKITPEEVLSKQFFTYTTGPDGGTQIEKIETFDEAEQGTLVSFGYGPYGRVNDKYEYGYKQGEDYQVRRRTHYDYVDLPGYLDKRFLRLVSGVTVRDAAGAPKAKTVIEYDNYAAMGGMEFYGLISGTYPPNHDDTYNQSYVFRGNPTAVTTFSQIVDPAESTTRRVRYDIFGNVVKAQVSCCVEKFFSFSNATYYSQPDWVRAGPESETELNMKTSYQYNDFTGLVEEETNPDGLPTTYKYDGALRLEKVTAPIGAETLTKFEKDGNGNDLLVYVSKTSYDDQRTRKVITGKRWFDGSGRVIRAGTGAGDAPESYDTVATVYDGWGRVAKRSNPYLGDANGNGSPQFWTTNTYDELSRVTKVTLPGADNQTIQRDYRGATATSGATGTVTDTVGRKHNVEVDGLGRLVKVTEQNPANGNLEWDTIYSYDTLDNLTQIYQGGQTRTFAYDAKSRLTSETTPEAGTTRYTYTPFDAVETRRDERGVITTYTYGPLNLLTGVSYNNVTGVAPTTPVSINYRNDSPGKGQINWATDGAGRENYGYDNFGQLQSRTREIDGISYETRYEYNAIGQMTLMIYPSRKRVKVERDAKGRLNAVQRIDVSGNMQEAYLSEINYRVDGKLSSRRLGDGTTENFGYSDDRLQLTSQTVTKGGATLLDLSYGYGAGAGQMGSGSTPGNSGQVVTITGAIAGQNLGQTFTYDNVGRLVTATGTGREAWARRHDYDRYGNVTKVWDAVSDGNPLQNTMIAQANGMTTNRIASVNGTAFDYDASGNVTREGLARAYAYDAENRLVSVSVNGVGSESYGYDAGNRRVKKVVGGVVTHYVWEGDQVIAEYERGGSNTLATGIRYYHQDRLSTRVITDGAGTVVGTTDHLPFGEEIGVSGQEEKHKFTSYERDGTVRDYALNRYYDPQRGRFNQVDPLGMAAASLTDPQSLNLYSYVRNNPVNLIDPTGLNLEHPESRLNLGLGGSRGTGFMSPGIHYTSRPDAEWGWVTTILFVSPGGLSGGGGNDVSGGLEEPADPQDDRTTTPDDKRKGDIPNCNAYFPFLDKKDCTHIAEVIKELTRSIHQRFDELIPGSARYSTHLDAINFERAELNKCIQKFEDENCGDGSAAMPPAFDMVWAKEEAGRPFPRAISVRDAVVNRGLGVPVGVVLVTVCLLCPLCCAATAAAGSRVPAKP